MVVFGTIMKLVWKFESRTRWIIQSL